jgi:hypothetical protein
VIEVDWERNPSFPGFRAEWLPGILRDEPGGPEGETYRVYEERRALFPVRPGVLEIPPVGIGCAAASERQRPSARAARVEVEPIPAGARPPGFSGLVGRVEATFTAEPREVVLGEAVQISLAVEGPGNLWEVRSPLEGAFSLPDAELFPRHGSMARDAGRRLILRRYFSYDLVPRRVGTIRIPEIRIPYFDPEARRFDEVVVPESALIVTAPAAVAQEAARGEARPADDREEDRERGSGLLGIGLLAGLAAALAFLALGRLRRSRRAAPSRRIEAALEQAEAAREAGESAAAARILARALRMALEARIPGARALTAEEILERAEDEPTRTLAERLARLERERFQPCAPPPETPPLREALEELCGRRR